MQLFTHLLSSYLQGMGDFFSALPWGGHGKGLQAAATLTELRFHSPGLRAKTATLGKLPH